MRHHYAARRGTGSDNMANQLNREELSRIQGGSAPMGAPPAPMGAPPPPPPGTGMPH
jgi:hypothetical protein